MEYTGIAGQILTWAVIITAYATLLLGLYIAWVWIFDIASTFILKSFKAYDAFIEFLLDKNKYKRKLKEIENESQQIILLPKDETEV